MFAQSAGLESFSEWVKRIDKTEEQGRRLNAMVLAINWYKKEKQAFKTEIETLVAVQVSGDIDTWTNLKQFKW